MGATISAIYENGVLRLLEPLNVPEHTRVEIIVQPQVDIDDLPPMERREAMRAVLRAAGLLGEISVVPDGVRPLTDDEREALTQRLPSDLALSDVILEEREGR